MKILNLRAENVKRLLAVEISPDGNLIEITGKNGQGKTSILDSIWWALAGTKHIQAEPIRDGENKALIRLHIGDEEVKYVVTRTFTRIDDPKPDQDSYRSTLTVTTPEGAKFGNPQEIITNLLGALTFDPLAFMRMKPEQQFEALRVFVPGFDFDANARRRKFVFDQRTDVNRDTKGLWAQVGAIAVPADAPTERQDEEALIQELEGVAERNGNIERAKAARQQALQGADLADQNADRLDSDAAELERRAAELRQQAQDARAHAKMQRDRVAEAEKKEPIPDPVDAAEVRGRLESARQANAVFADVERKRDLTAKANASEARAKGLTDEIEGLDKARIDAVAAAKMPVEGLGFGDDEVLFNGVPLAQASDAEQLRVSVAIAAAMSPELRVIRVRDGSLLDRDSFKLLADFAEAKKLQLWVETVDSGRAGAVVITDGHVEGVDPADLVAPKEEEKPVRQVRQARQPRAAAPATDEPAADGDLFQGD